jgi:hypothetical protein
VEDSCKHGNESSDCINFLESLESLSDWRLLKDSAPWTEIIMRDEEMMVAVSRKLGM